MKNFIALLLILELLSGCTAPVPAEDPTAVTEPAEDATDPLEGPEGLPTPAL